MQIQIQIQILMQTQAPRQKVHFSQESNQPVWKTSSKTNFEYHPEVYRNSSYRIVFFVSFHCILGRSERFITSQNNSDQVYDQAWSRCLLDWLLVSCGPSWQGDPRPWESPGSFMLISFSQDYDEYDYDKDPPLLGGSRSLMLMIVLSSHNWW